LGLDLLSDDSLEISDDGGERVRTDGGTDAVVGGGEIDDPVSHGFVDGVLEGLGTGSDGDDLRTRRKRGSQSQRWGEEE